MGMLNISDKSLSQLMPMHLQIAADGRIISWGPTLEKLFVDTELSGARFFDLFIVRRPLWVATIQDIIAANGQKLHLSLQNGSQTTLKAVGVVVGGNGDVLLNLSLGISVVDAIGDYNLTIGDFAATDLAIEMLYLIEAKSAAMAESRKLNTRLQGARIEAEEQAFSDTLTGLKNRRAMDHVLTRFIDTNEKFGLMQIDLDYFKRVNDTLGHAAGDHVLLKVAKILLDETRSVDLVARVGGDEFVLIFHQLTDIAQLNEIAARIIARLEVPIMFAGQSCRISASIGTTVSDYYSALDMDKILSDADKALYASKHKGRACYTVFTKDLAQDAQA